MACETRHTLATGVFIGTPVMLPLITPLADEQEQTCELNYVTSKCILCHSQATPRYNNPSIHGLGNGLLLVYQCMTDKTISVH
jgi:hypothetical protein